MSSEAAQKAYPANVGPMSSGFVDHLNQSRQEAFDRGAVEALRQAAKTLRGKFDANPTDHLMRMADEWEMGSA